MNRKIVTPLLIVMAGVGFAFLLIATGPKVEPRSPVVSAPLVRVLNVVPESIQLRVSTHGTVAPRTESELVPEVSGPVIWISPAMVSGGFFDAGEALLRIDALDYEVALDEARARLEEQVGHRAPGKRSAGHEAGPRRDQPAPDEVAEEGERLRG